MSPSDGQERLRSWSQEAAVMALAAFPATMGLLSGRTFTVGGSLTKVFAILTLIAALASTAVIHLRLRAGKAKQARYQAIYERAGISMWSEDWTAAAREIEGLRRSGIADVESYFADRPEELRALRSRIMVTDVNAFTVEEIGAESKMSCLGSLDQLLPDTDQTFVQWLVAISQGDRFFRSEAHIIKPDGTHMDSLFAAAIPTHSAGFAEIIVTSLDITGYKRQQAQYHAADAELAKTSRTSAIGALSASIAHEVSSPLAAVLANAQAAQRWLCKPEADVGEALEAVNAIVADASRARDVVVRTRALVQQAPLTAEPVDIVNVAREAIVLVEHELRRCGASVHVRAQPNLPNIDGDAVQLRQVFTNLLANAAQAMTSKTGTRDIRVTFETADRVVVVEVADDGSGIEDAHVGRVFDVFHSTKPGGMGVGLAICRDVIEAHGGSIQVRSPPGEGATLRLELPSSSVREAQRP